MTYAMSCPVGGCIPVFRYMVPGDGAGVGPCRVVIGFNNQRFSAPAPLIELVATPEKLEFRARFGLGRFLGAWCVEQSQVAAVFRAPGVMSDCVAVHGSHYLGWSNYSFH